MNLDVFLPRALAALAAGVKESTIGNWRERGWVDDTGTRRELTVRLSRNGKLEYRLGDVLDAERDTFRNPRSPGRRRRVPASI